MSFPVPVLLVGFNRPHATSQVVSILREVKPSRLYVACDGPRPNRSGDVERCHAVRQLFSSVSCGGLVDWPCELFTLFHEKNLGCLAGPVAALDWFFEKEEEGIILEDDILPDLSFFPYCQELLSRFRDDSRVGSISANNLLGRGPKDGSSYRFSIYTHSWGWATWRRAWTMYDRDLSGWPAFRSAGWLEQLGGKSFARTWKIWIDQVASNQLDAWDVIWQMSGWQQGFLTVIPEVELANNIGFGPDATHTLDENSPLATVTPISLPLRHPSVMQPDRQSDADTFSRLYQRSPVADLKRKIRKGLRLLNLR